MGDKETRAGPGEAVLHLQVADCGQGVGTWKGEVWEQKHKCGDSGTRMGARGQGARAYITPRFICERQNADGRVKVRRGDKKASVGARP